jgi:hypothetical protein
MNLTKQEVDAAIVADLINPLIRYSDISSKYRVAVARIIALAKAHGLTRPRGRKTKVQG